MKKKQAKAGKLRRKAREQALLAALRAEILALRVQIDKLRAEIPNVNIRHDLPFCPGGTRLC